jgi:hypothetical protein
MPRAKTPSKKIITNVSAEPEAPTTSNDSTGPEAPTTYSRETEENLSQMGKQLCEVIICQNGYPIKTYVVVDMSIAPPEGQMPSKHTTLLLSGDLTLHDLLSTFANGSQKEDVKKSMRWYCNSNLGQSFQYYMSRAKTLCRGDNPDFSFDITNMYLSPSNRCQNIFGMHVGASRMSRDANFEKARADYNDALTNYDKAIALYRSGQNNSSVDVNNFSERMGTIINKGVKPLMLPVEYYSNVSNTSREPNISEEYEMVYYLDYNGKPMPLFLMQLQNLNKFNNLILWHASRQEYASQYEKTIFGQMKKQTLPCIVFEISFTLLDSSKKHKGGKGRKSRNTRKTRKMINKKQVMRKSTSN